MTRPKLLLLDFTAEIDGDRDVFAETPSETRERERIRRLLAREDFREALALDELDGSQLDALICALTRLDVRSGLCMRTVRQAMDSIADPVAIIRTCGCPTDMTVFCDVRRILFQEGDERVLQVLRRVAAIVRAQ